MPLADIGVIPLGMDEVGYPLSLSGLGVALVNRAVRVELDRSVPRTDPKRTRLELRKVDRRGLINLAGRAARLRRRRATAERSTSRHADPGKQRGLGKSPTGKRSLA